MDSELLMFPPHQQTGGASLHPASGAALRRRRYDGAEAKTCCHFNLKMIASLPTLRRCLPGLM